MTDKKERINIHEYLAEFDDIPGTRVFTAQRGADTPDELWLLQHPPVYTLGQAGKPEHLLQNPANIPLVRIDRGGQITYHGPGQLVAYPIVDLRPDRCDVRRYVRDLAEVMIRLASDHGIAAGYVQGFVGTWVFEEHPTTFDQARAEDTLFDRGPHARLGKIGAIGVRLSRWVTMHGFAFNVSTDLTHFGHIVPCGIAQHAVASLAKLGVAHGSVEELAKSGAVRHFGDVFGVATHLASEGDTRAFLERMMARPEPQTNG